MKPGLNISVHLEEVFPIQLDKEIKNYTHRRDNYSDLVLIHQQFEGSNLDYMKDIEVNFTYSNKSERVYLHELQVVYYNSNEEKWIRLDTVIDKNKIIAKLPKLTVERRKIRFGFVINQFHYSSYTEIMGNIFPLWTDIKQSKESNGKKFLNSFGIKIEEVFKWAQWVSGEKYLKTADINEFLFIYEYKIKNFEANKEYEFYTADGFRIEESHSTRKFFEPSHSFTYIKDVERSVIFTKEKIEPIVLVDGEDGEVLNPEKFYLWNTFDEFGLLLDLSRNEGESNADYKERLYDVFRYPSGSNKSGIQFALAKELGLLNKEIWLDDRKPFVIKRKREPINPHAIRVDYEPLKRSQYKILSNGDIFIYPMADLVDDNTFVSYKTERVVGYVNDINAYEIFNKDDVSSLKDIYQWEDDYELRMREIIKEAQVISPIMWGYARWDHAYWDNIKKGYSGVGFLPTHLDSNLLIWKDQSIEGDE